MPGLDITLLFGVEAEVGDHNYIHTSTAFYRKFLLRPYSRLYPDLGGPAWRAGVHRVRPTTRRRRDLVYVHA